MALVTSFLHRSVGRASTVMLRRGMLFFALLLAYWRLAALGMAQDPINSGKDNPVVHPNVLLLLADDLGWGDLGCYGHQRLKTPHLDALAKEGTLFTQFYSASSLSSPSRAALLTGRFPAGLKLHGSLASKERNQQRGMPDFLDPNVTTVADAMKSVGYSIGWFGKWNLGEVEEAPLCAEYGFDEAKVIAGKGSAYSVKGPKAMLKSVASIVDDTLSFVKKHQTKPWFATASFPVPQSPLDPSDEMMAAYSALQPPVKEFRSAAQIYYSSVTEMDSQIGRLLKGLEALGRNNTLVIFTSDNGPEDINSIAAGHSGVGSTGPFRGKQGSLYEGGVRVPFILRWPGKIPAGRVEDAAVLASVDLFPSLCQVAGAAIPEGTVLDGAEASEAWLGKSWIRTKPLYWDCREKSLNDPLHRSPTLAIREDQWKLLVNPDKSRLELYDIPRDPSELSNLAAQRPNIVARLMEKVLAWHKAQPNSPSDPEAGKNDYPWPKSAQEAAPAKSEINQPPPAATPAPSPLQPPPAKPKAE